MVKNSLLTESIINNSFLITQGKKLIGSGALDNNYSNKTLWLPTKMSKVSSIESTIMFNNLSQQLFNEKQPTNFLKTNKLTHQNFTNLNFFENSRLWVFKKYFFNNSQNMNLVIDSPILYKPNLSKEHVLRNYELASTSFYTNNTVSKLHHLINNLYTPSLCSNIITDGYTRHSSRYSNILKPSTLINMPSTDLINGSGINFLYTITSNPKNFNGLSTNYFNWLESGTTLSTYNLNLPYKNIKFHN